jgi:hypothetical protein
MERPPAHVAGDLGELAFERALTRESCVPNKLHRDYGYDYLAHVMDGNTVTAHVALFQVKTGRAADSNFHLRLEARHLTEWANSPVPTFLAAVELNTERVFVISCHDLANDLGIKNIATETITIHIAPETELTPERALRLRQQITTFWAEHLPELLDFLNRERFDEGPSTAYRHSAQLILLSPGEQLLLGMTITLGNELTLKILRAVFGLESPA